MHTIDTNVLVRLVTRDDERQVSAAEKFISQGAWVPAIVLAEASWVLASVYELKPAAIAIVIEMLLNHQTLVLQDAAAVAEALEVFRGTPSLGFSDCLILSLARASRRLPLGTFDARLSKIEGAQKL